MPFIKKIMVTTDFTPVGDEAVPYAFRLAGQLGAEVLLFTMVEKHHSEGYIDYAPAEGDGKAYEALGEAREKLLALVPEELRDKVPHEAVPAAGHVSPKTIIGAVHHHAPDLFVIASHNLSGLEALVLGSTSDKVIRSIDCPTLVVKSSN